MLSSFIKFNKKICRLRLTDSDIEIYKTINASAFAEVHFTV